MSFYSIARGFVKGLSHIICPIKVHGDISVMPEDSGVIISANLLSYFAPFPRRTAPNVANMILTSHQKFAFSA